MAFITGSTTVINSSGVGTFYSCVASGEGGFKVTDSSPYIDFKNSGSDDYDARMIQTFNGYRFFTGGSGTLRFNLDDSGDNCIGGTPGLYNRLKIIGADQSSSNYCFFFENDTPVTVFYVRNDGLISTGTSGSSPYNLGNAGAANVYVDSNGVMYTSTSSRKYKTNIQENQHGLQEVLRLRSVTFKSKNSGDRIFGGLIAEEVHDLGLTEFVEYNKNNEPDGIHYSHMVALMAKAIQEFKVQIDTLNAELLQLENI